MAGERPDTHLFSHHPRSWEKNRYVYPVISRRSHGLSVGINLNTDRICNFDCVYCCVDRSEGGLKPEAVDLAVLQRELDDMLTIVQSGELWRTAPFDQTPAPLRRFADIAFSGDGEPTASPVFAQACQIAVESRARHQASAAKIVLITNATLFHHGDVDRSLAFLDRNNGEIWAKLDAGNEQVYRQLIRTTIPLSRIMDNILRAGKERPIVIQSMFLCYNGNDPAPADIDDYLARLKELREGGCQIRLVQAYTVARPVFRTQIAPADARLLDRIVASVRALGIAAEAYYAPSASGGRSDGTGNPSR